MTLSAYLAERLQTLQQALSATTLELSDKSPCLPLNYGEETVGYLHYQGCEPTPALEAAAGQFAALLKAPDPKLAIALDRLMAKLQTEEPVCDWTGVYLLRADVLYLTAYRGAPTPHPIIPRSKGICGAAVEENRTLNIEDVTLDPRYLSCDIRARSELVVPIRDATGNPVGEIDIDSHLRNAFHAALVSKVEELAREIARQMLN